MVFERSGAYQTSMMRRLAPILAVLACGAGAAVRADSAKPPPVHEGASVSIQAYGKQNPLCLSWTNGCVLCSAGPEGASQCSTPGIACQPHGLHCKLMRPKEGSRPADPQ